MILKYFLNTILAIFDDIFFIRHLVHKDLTYIFGLIFDAGKSQM